MAGPSSMSSVCSIMTTASAPRGMTPPVAIVVAVPDAISIAGATPQAITSALSARRFGAPSLAPIVSAARTAKPSTLERSNGGASTGAITSAASTRACAEAKGRDCAPSGAWSTQASKRRRASAAETTSRNCSCRAARRTASTIAAPRCFGFMTMISRRLMRLLENPRSRRERQASHRSAPAPSMTDNRCRAALPYRLSVAPEQARSGRSSTLLFS